MSVKIVGEKLKINKMYKFDWIKAEMELEQIIMKAEKEWKMQK